MPYPFETSSVYVILKDETLFKKKFLEFKQNQLRNDDSSPIQNRFPFVVKENWFI
jgi:hypothetical protein